MKAGKVITIVLLSAIVLLTGCASKDSAREDSDSSSRVEMGAMDLEEDGADTNGFNNAVTVKSTASGSAEDFETEETETASTNRKLIRRIMLELQTLEFDTTLDFINKQVELAGGYMENSEMEGSAYDGSGDKYASLIIRIPSTKVDDFLKQVDENTFVVSRQESTEDITLAYVDTKSHIKALEIEQERLLALLEKADKLADIIALEERLSSVRYEIESYGSTLRTYDNLVSYSTVTLYLSEVERVIPKEEENAFDRMGTGLKETFFNIKDGFVNFTVWFVVNLPYFILWGGIFLIGALIIRKVRNRHNSPLNPVSAKKATEKNK